MKKKSLGVNALLSSFQRLLNVVFPLITFPYITRTLSVNDVGKYNFSSSIVSYFLLFAALGISTYAVREGTKLRDKRKEISEFASKVFSINLASTLLSYVIMGVVLIAVPKLHAYTYCILILGIQVFFTTLGTEWIYTIFEEYAYITLRNIVFKLISIALLFIFVRKPEDYLHYAAITVVASTGSYFLNFIHARKFCDIRVVLHFNWKELLKPIMIIFAANVAVQIYVSSDTTMLGFIKGDYLVGIYSVSVKVYNTVANVLGGFLVVTVPRLSMLMGQERMGEYHDVLKRVMNTMMVLAAPCMIILFALSNIVVLVIGGQNYTRSISSLRILCIALGFKLFSTIFNDCVLIPAKREVRSMYNFIFAALLNIGLNIIFIPIWGELGAAFTTVLAEGSTAFLNFYFGRDIIIKSIRNKDFSRNVITVAIGSGLLIVVCCVCNWLFQDVWIKFAIILLLSCLLYGTVLWILKNPAIENSVNRLIKR